MNYETLYIVHPALESGRLKDIISSFEEIIVKMGGKTLSIEILGKKRLAYLITKQKYGTYVQFQFICEGNCISSLRKELDHNPNILSYLTTLIEEEAVIKQENDLDTQIAGYLRETQRIDRLSETKEVSRKNSPKDDKTHLVETKIADNTENSIEKSGEIDSEASTATGDDDKTNSSDIPEAVETDVSKENIENEEKNLENADETSAVSEEE